MFSKSMAPLWINRRLRSLVLMIVGVLLIAAAWRGVFDVPSHQDPLQMQRWEVAEFITSTVNRELTTKYWSRGDTVTLCQGGGNNCGIFTFLPSGTDSWYFTRKTDSRSKPVDATLWERFWKWLTPSVVGASDVNFAWYGWDQSMKKFPTEQPLLAR